MKYLDEGCFQQLWEIVEGSYKERVEESTLNENQKNTLKKVKKNYKGYSSSTKESMKIYSRKIQMPNP